MVGKRQRLVFAEDSTATKHTKHTLPANTRRWPSVVDDGQRLVFAGLYTAHTVVDDKLSRPPLSHRAGAMVQYS